MKPKTVVVIGAGIGGITAAIHLAKQGLQVTVLEKNARPGGHQQNDANKHHLYDMQSVPHKLSLIVDSSALSLWLLYKRSEIGSEHRTIEINRPEATRHNTALTIDDKCRRDTTDAKLPRAGVGLDGQGLCSLESGRPVGRR